MKQLFLKIEMRLQNSFTPLCSGYLCLAWRKHVQPSIVNCFFDIFCSLRWYVRPYPTLPNNSSGIIITVSRFYHLKLRPVNVYYVSNKSKKFWAKLWSLILLCLFKNILTCQCFQHGIFNSDIMLMRNHKTSHLLLLLIDSSAHAAEPIGTPSVHTT